MNYKKILLVLLSFQFSVIASKAGAQEYVQNAYGRAMFNLDGQWDRIVDPYENGYYNHRYLPHENGYFKNEVAKTKQDLVEYSFSGDKKLHVPGDWNTQEQELMFYEGTVWYHKDFNINKRTAKRYLIHFGAVNYKAIVYINGVLVGDHEGGFTSFQFDITDKLVSGNNSVVVKADDRRERNQVPTINTDWWNYGGITRSVAIMELPDSYVADYSLQLNGASYNEIKASVSLVGSNIRAGNVEVAIPELQIKQTIKVNNGKGNIIFPARPSLWTPENPKLYNVEIAFNGELIKDKIGFRTIAVKGENIELNGKSVFLRGISIHEESPYGARRAWSEDDARTLLLWAKELGCNFVRLAHYPHNENMLKLADELGLMVWSEIPVYWTVMFEDKDVYGKAEKQLTEMIVRDKNRASIVLWSVANETPNHSARLKFLTNLIKKARSLDDSRLITAAMDTQSATKDGKSVDDPLAKFVDVIGINNYCGWYSMLPSECGNQKWISHYNKPLIMSELGAAALQGLHGNKDERWSEEYQADVYKNNILMLENMSALRGVSPWILKDFRSPRRQLPGIQDYFNRKGLLSEFGVRKQAWYVLHDYYKKKEADSQ